MRTRTHSVLLDMDAGGLLAAAAEEEGGDNGGGGGALGLSSPAPSGDAAVSFTPVNGTGVVFFMDAAGGLRGVLVWGLMPPPSSAGAGAGDGCVRCCLVSQSDEEMMTGLLLTNVIHSIPIPTQQRRQRRGKHAHGRGGAHDAGGAGGHRPRALRRD